MHKQSTWRWLLSSIQPYRGRVALIMLSAMVVSVSGGVMPLLLQKIIDSAVAGEFNTLYVGLMVAASIVSTLPFTYMQRQHLSHRYRYHLRGTLLKHLLNLDLAFHDNHGSTRVVTEAAKGVSGADRLVNFMSNGQIIIQIPIAIIAAVYIANQSMTAFLLLLTFILLFAVVGKVLGNKISELEEVWNDIDTSITDRHRESVYHISTVKMHRAEQPELNRYWQEGQKALDIRWKVTRWYGTFNLLSNAGSYFATLLIIFMFIPKVIDGSITVGTFFALSMYAERVTMPATFIGNLYAEIKRELAKIRPLMDILEAQPEVVERENAVELAPLRTSIELQNLTFAYPKKDVSVLKGVNLTIPAGQKTALVGETGSGKSTLAKLLARFYDPTDGQILIDGIDLRDATIRSLREQLVVLPQEVPIFSGTVYENIVIGIENPSDEEVQNAIEKAAATFIYSEGFDGLDTIVGETGKKLSGGQRQRIALARIFMRNPSIILLDEATSAVDNVTESQIQSSFADLARMNGGRTMIVIAHRLSTVRDADQIVVFDNGTIVDIGTHDELLGRCSRYQELNRTDIQ